MHGRMLILLLAGCLIIPSPGRAGQYYDGPIIDTHQHADSELRATYRICLPRPCDAAATVAKTAAELKPMTLEAMRRNNIVLAVVMDNVANVQAWTDGEGDLMLTGLGVGDPKDRPVHTLRPLFVSGRAQVLGEIFSQYEGITLDDPGLDPYFALAAEFDVPVHAHLLGAGGRAGFPSHLGKRIMFGSDQMSWPEVIDVAVDTIQTADFLTVEQKADIFYNNAARFFRLTPEQVRAHHEAVAKGS